MLPSLQDLQSFRSRAFKACFLSLFLCGLFAFFSSWCKLPLAQFLWLASGVVFIVSILTYAYARSWQAMQEEAEEREGLRQRYEGESELFAQEGGLSEERSFQVYQKTFLPLATLALSGLALFSLYQLWFQFSDFSELVFADYVKASAFSAVFAITTFLMGAYYSGASRERASRALRPLAGWLYFISFVSLVFSLALFFQEKSLGQLFLFRLFLILGAILFVEMILNTIFEFYRPRSKEEDQSPCESRILSLLTEPGSVLANLSHVLEYQFGLQVSEKWLRQLSYKLLLPVFLIQLFLLLSLSSLTQIEEGEQGLKYRFGHLQADILEPGFHLKWPWPIDRVESLDVAGLRRVFVGYEGQKKAEAHAESKFDAEDSVVLWGRSHKENERRFLLTERSSGELSKVSFANMNLVLFYRVANARLYYQGQKDAEKSLQAIAEEELLSFLARSDFREVFGRDRQALSETLKKNIQNHLIFSDLGVDLHSVAIDSLHPTKDVYMAFDNVVAARYEADAKIFSAQAKALEESLEASLKAEEQEQAARAEQTQKILFAQERAERFRTQQKLYHTANKIYQLHAFLDAMGTEMKERKKYILTLEGADENIVLDLKEKFGEDFLEKLREADDK